jgi:hypothetical protein
MRYLWFLIAAICLCGVASAVPTTGQATNIGNNNATFNGAGITGQVGWFQFGFPKTVYAHTPNVTSQNGTITYTMKSMPLTGNTTFAYKACDPTGCGGEVTFLTAVVTPLPTVTFGQYAENITQNGLDPGNMIWNAIQPYTAVTTQTVFFGLIFAMIFIGIWLRTRQTGTAVQLGVICAVFVVSSAYSLQLGIPPIWAAAAQALLIISLAGMVVSFTFK